MSKKILHVATVVKTHIMSFHLPCLEMCKNMEWETAVAARNDYADKSECSIPFCDQYFDISFKRSPWSFGNIGAYKKLSQVINDGNYDIIHCHTPVGGVLTRLAARKERKKGTQVFYTAHGFHFYKGAPLLNWLLFYPIERLLSRLTDVLITINREDYERAKTFHAKKVVYIPGVGINTEKFATPLSAEEKAVLRSEIGVPEDAALLCSVGELNKNKNHQLIIRAIAQLDDESIHYCIAGEGEERENLVKLAESLNLSDRVHLLGYRRDINKLYRASDICCFPSMREGLPVALMEAMACALPVICSDIRGNCDLLSDSEGGYLLSPTDHFKWAEKIRDLSENSETARKFGQHNFDIIKDYDSAKILSSMKELYLDTKERD